MDFNEPTDMERTSKDILLRKILDLLSVKELINMILDKNRPVRISAAALSRGTGLKVDNISNWAVDTDPSEKFSHAKDALIDFVIKRKKDILLKKELEMLKNKSESAGYNYNLEHLISDPEENYELNTSSFVGIYLKEHGRFKIYDEEKVDAGHVTFIDQEPVLIALNKPSYYAGPSDGQIILKDKSMEPEIKEGAVIYIRKLPFADKYNDGDIFYIIDCNYVGMVRMLERVSDQRCRLVPINKDYKTIEKEWDDILAIFKVEGDFKKR